MSQISFTKFVLLSLICPFIFISYLKGQSLKQTKENIPLNQNYNLEKKYEFIAINKDTILDGAFLLTLKPSSVDTITEKKYHFKELSFIYRNNKKEGSFELTGYELTPEFRDFFPSGNHIRIPYQGELFKHYGTFKNDRPEGLWTFIKSSKGQNVNSDTLIVADVNFNKSGNLKGVYHYQNNDHKIGIKGSFTDNGLFQGSWKIVKGKETLLGNSEVTLHFEEGKLQSISSFQQEEPALIHANINKNFEALPLSPLYLEYLKMQLPEWMTLEKAQQITLSVNEVLDSFNYLSLDYTGLTKFIPGGLNFEAPKVQLPVYDTSEKIRQNLDQNLKSVTSLRTKIDSILTNPPFKSNIQAEKEIGSLHLKAVLLKEKVKHAFEILSIVNKPVARHIDLETYVKNHLPVIQKTDQGTFSYKEDLYTEELELQSAPENLDSFEKLNFYVIQLNDKALQIEVEAKSQYQKLIRNKTLLENEETLEQLSEGIDIIADSLYLPLYRVEIENIYKASFTDFKEQQLNEYHSLSSDEKVLSIDTLITCFEDVKQKLSRSWLLVEKAQLVDQVYMEMKLNPYTYEKMNIRVYDKLFKAYHDKIIPYLISGIMPASSCNGFIQRINNIEIVQDFMLEARKGNTRRLERQFRAGDHPEVIIKKLGIPIH